MTWALRTEGATMREIDLLDLRWHKGEPTWGIIDELLEMIDASPSEEEIESRVQDARADGYKEGHDDGFEEGYDNGHSDGYDDAYWEGRADKAGHD